MHIKTDSLAPITQDEMIFIRTLANKEFKSTDLCENIRLKSKIYDICYKLRASSFEEVLRKVLFYKLFKIDLSDEYLEHVEAYSREKISTLCTLRNTTAYGATSAHRHTRLWKQASLPTACK